MRPMCRYPVLLTCLLFLICSLLAAQNPLPSDTIDFGSFTGSDLSEVHAGWFETPDSLQEETDSEWTADDFGNDVESSNGRAARLRFELPEMEAWIVSPLYTADHYTFCLFDLALTQAFTETEALLPETASMELLFRKEGEDFESLFQLSATSTINAEHWLALPVDSADVFQLAFRARTSALFENEYADLFLDNIRFLSLPETDLRIVELIAPVQKSCYGDAEQVALQIQNFGATSIDLAALNGSVDLQLSSPISDQNLIQDLAGILAPGESFTVELDSLLDMAAYGSYLFDFELQLDGDLEETNNDILEFRNYAEPAFSLLDTFYFDDFGGADISTVELDWQEARGLPDSLILETLFGEGISL